MPNIIIKDRPVDDVLEDLGLDTDQRRRATEMIRDLVEESFGERRDAYPRTEVLHRIRILVRWFCVMYADLEYTIERCRNSLPSALACELAGMQYVPAEHVAGQGYKKHKRGAIPWTRL